MKIAILQPHYFPYIGYFSLIKKSDIFVFLDDVDFIKREWKNRNKIRLNNHSNDTTWLSIPIKKNFQQNCKINKVLVDNLDLELSLELQFNKLKNSYYKSPHFNMLGEIFKFQLKKNFNLSLLNINSVEIFFDLLKIKTKIIKSSDLKISGKKSEKLLNICKILGASTYFANNKSKEYLDENSFLKNNISVKYQDYVHPVYDQIYDNKKLNFIPYLSILDLIANQGDQSWIYI